MATAAALRQIASVDAVTVIESRGNDSLENETAGAAIQLTPNAFRALEAIGGPSLVETIRSAGSEVTDNLILLPGGAPPLSNPNTAMEDTGYPIVMVRWGVLRKLLGELLPPESLLFGTRFSEIAGYALLEHGDTETETETETVYPVNRKGERIAIEGLSSSSSSNNLFSPQLIVGADGLHSVFRDRIQTGSRLPETDEPGPSVPLKDNGRVNIKAVVRCELKELNKIKNKNDQSSPSSSTATSTTVFGKEGATVGQFDPRLAAFAGPAGTGYTYWAISVADDPETGSRFLSPELLENKAAAKEVLLEKLGGLEGREWISTLVEKTDAGVILINRSLEATVKEENSFVSKDGRIVLVGDAAHAMNPAYGQSASFAFEDAATLALHLKKTGVNGNSSNNINHDEIQKALREYSDKRLGRCMEIQRRSEERAAKAMRGEKAEDVSKWIFAWEP